jgi:prepilin-type N-terminal cleavage/methylation domain-containing protein
MRNRGFSLLECLVSLALLTAVMAVLVPAVLRGTQLARLQPDVADLDQRLRLAHATIQRALEEAGAGSASPALSPSLAGLLPVVFPARRAVTGGDPPDQAFVDRISLVSMSADGWEAPLAASMATATSPLVLLGGPPCPVSEDRCGFRPGDLGVVADRLGAFDLTEVRAVVAGTIDHTPATLTQPYQVDQQARVVRARLRQFVFDPLRRQIRTSDGINAAVPMLDAVTALECEYFGLTSPPMEPRPPLGTASCLFNPDGTSRLVVLPGAPGRWVVLPTGLFRDGPFCGVGPMRYDADLLRVRRVVVRIRVGGGGVSPAEGVASPLRGLDREREVIVDVVLRNLEPH